VGVIAALPYEHEREFVGRARHFSAAASTRLKDVGEIKLQGSRAWAPASSASPSRLVVSSLCSLWWGQGMKFNTALAVTPR
jgi:hypothetical protein